MSRGTRKRSALSRLWQTGGAHCSRRALLDGAPLVSGQPWRTQRVVVGVSELSLLQRLANSQGRASKRMAGKMPRSGGSLHLQPGLVNLRGPAAADSPSSVSFSGLAGLDAAQGSLTSNALFGSLNLVRCFCSRPAVCCAARAHCHALWSSVCTRSRLGLQHVHYRHPLGLGTWGMLPVSCTVDTEACSMLHPARLCCTLHASAARRALCATA